MPLKEIFMCGRVLIWKEKKTDTGDGWDTKVWFLEVVVSPKNRIYKMCIM